MAGFSRDLKGAIGPAMWAVEMVCCLLLHFGFGESWFEIHLNLILNLHIYSKYLLLVQTPCPSVEKFFVFLKLD